MFLNQCGVDTLCCLHCDAAGWSLSICQRASQLELNASSKSVLEKCRSWLELPGAVARSLPPVSINPCYLFLLGGDQDQTEKVKTSGRPDQTSSTPTHRKASKHLMKMAEELVEICRDGKLQLGSRNAEAKIVFFNRRLISRGSLQGNRPQM